MTQFKKRKIPALLLSASILPSVPIPAAMAQESLALEEVIVTARRRVESLQDAPLAVSAVSGEMLKDAGFTNLAILSWLVPPEEDKFKALSSIVGSLYPVNCVFHHHLLSLKIKLTI